MTANPKQLYTEEEYLASERASETRHEFFRGEIFAIAGGSPTPVLIATNTSFALNTQLLKRGCLVYQADLRVKMAAVKHYTYPDIVVVCEKPVFDAKDTVSLINPTLIVEVLSPSTEAYDRGKKFEHFQTLPSLREYILIAQDAARIEQFVRQPDNSWVYKDAVGLDAALLLPSINCTLALADVYANVTFDSTPES